MLIWIKHIVLSTTNMVSIFLLYDYQPFVGSLFGYFSQFLTRPNPKMHDEMNLVVLVISIIWDFWLFSNIFQKILLQYSSKKLQIVSYGPYDTVHTTWSMFLDSYHMRHLKVMQFTVLWAEDFEFKSLKRTFFAWGDSGLNCGQWTRSSLSVGMQIPSVGLSQVKYSEG